MVMGLFKPIGYQSLDIPKRARSLEPFISSFYAKEGLRSRDQLQTFIKNLPGPLGGRGLDTNVAAKLAAHYNQRERIKAASLKDPFLTIRNSNVLPVNIVRQQTELSYTIKVGYYDIDGEPASQIITILSDDPFDDIGFEAVVISKLDEGGRAERYKRREAGFRPSIEELDATRRNPDL